MNRSSRGSGSWLSGIAFILAVVLVVFACGCTSQSRARNFGGEETITLPMNEKLINITWKDSELWYLTRPMREGETAEAYAFAESSAWGVLEGTVYICEQDANGVATPSKAYADETVSEYAYEGEY